MMTGGNAGGEWPISGLTSVGKKAAPDTVACTVCALCHLSDIKFKYKKIYVTCISTKI